VSRIPTALAAACAALAITLALPLLAAPAGPATEATPRPATEADCQHLLHQFDVAWPARKDAVRADAAHRSRDQGETDCRAGRYTEGVHLLRRALHDIGVKPVKSVAAPPRP
jgi:hypothetical protein